MSELPYERCNRCRFWREDLKHRDPNDVDCGLGWCRVRPPVLVECIVQPLMPQLAYGQQIDMEMDALDLISATKFPATTSIDWCGQFEPKAGEAPL